MSTTRSSNFQAGLRTTILLASLTGLLVVIGALIGGASGAFTFLVIAAVMNMGAFWFSDRIALKMSGAQPLAEEDAPQIYEMVRELTTRAKMPMPKLYVIPQDQPNAFATGRSPSKGAVAVTTGIMRILDRDELAGVLAHELAHIKHRDTLLSAIVATIAGAITMIANIGQWALIFGGMSGDDEEGGDSLLGNLLLLFVAPLAATLIQLGISRAREFQADAGGARILDDPLPLASALEKLEWAARRVPMAANPAVAALYIVNPLRGAGVLRLFRTHPLTEDRVARLRALARHTHSGSVAAR
jgi:heat shock protein HtpX